MNFSNQENDENLAFSRTFQFCPILEYSSNNVMYAKTIVPGLNRFYRGHLPNTPNVKTFFGYAFEWQIL